MNKHLLLSCIKTLTFVLKSSTEYNIHFIYHKKGKQTKFLHQTQNICLPGFKVSICFQNYQSHYFFCSQENKFSTVKEIFLDQEIFPQSRKFFLIKEFFHSQGNLLQKKIYLIKEMFLKQTKFSCQGNFPQKQFT